MNFTTNKFFFIQLIIVNLLKVLKDHKLATAYSKFILLVLLFNFVNLFLFSYYHFFPNLNECLTFRNLLELLLLFQISSENNKLCNSNNYTYKLVNYFFLKLA